MKVITYNYYLSYNNMGCVPTRRINSRPLRPESVKTSAVYPGNNIEVR
jgi:hypothetical protein